MSERFHDFEVERTADGWTISGYEGDAYQLAIPSDIDGSPVVLIAARAFEDNPNLVEVEIPDTITFVGNYAFAGCSSLERATLYACIDSLNLGTFWNCTALTEVKLPPALDNLGDGAFRDCTALRSLEVPPSVTRIGDRAFAGCSALESIVLDGGIRTIERSAFRDCTSLSRVIVNSSLRSVGPRAFQNCPQLDRVTILGGDIDASLTAFRNLSMTYLVTDYAIERGLVTFDEAKKLLNSKDESDLILGARVAASNPDRLSEVISKQKMARTLAARGCTSELRTLAQHDGFLTDMSIPACIEVATAAGRTETTAYLLDLLAQKKGGSDGASPATSADSLKL